jgi:uncharacterized membrane protein YphA (DoxX/SURF4 family)
MKKKILRLAEQFLRSPGFYLAIRLVIGGIFIYAGFTKLIDPKAFARAISQYDLVPEILLPVVAIGLPALELLSGIGLIFNVRGSLTIIFSLLVIFSGVLALGIFNNLDIDCGCFTTEEIAGQNSLKLAFYRDLVMIAASLYMYLYRRSNIGLEKSK